MMHVIFCDYECMSVRLYQVEGQSSNANAAQQTNDREKKRKEHRIQLRTGK